MPQNEEVRTTIDDVAKLAGVSLSTVSQVYSSNRPVSPSTRKKVLEAAHKLSYRPSSSARALAKGRTLRLLLHFPVPSEGIGHFPYLIDMLTGLSRAAARRDYAFLVTSTDSWPGVLEATGGPAGLDGVVIIDPLERDDFTLKLFAEQVPVVSLGRIPGRQTQAWVREDIASWTKLLAERLAQSGYERPVLVSELRTVMVMQELEAAFLRELPHGRVIQADSQEITATVLRAALSDPSPPDAFVCITPEMHKAISDEISRAGRTVPEDVGIVLIADPAKQLPGIQGTTMLAISVDDAADALIALLDEVIEHDVDEESVITLPVSWIQGTSTRQPVDPRS